MKKILSMVLALTLMVSLAIPAFATEFVPSIENKGAPEILVLGQDENPTHGDSKNIIGYAVDKDGNVLHTAYEKCIIVYSLRDILDSDADIPEDIKEQLLEIYTSFTSGSAKYSELSDELNAAVAAIFGEGKDADMLVIKEIFDVNVHCEGLKDALAPEGTTVDFTFDVDIPAGESVFMLCYKNNEWVMVEKIVNNNENDITEDDGTITVTFENFCPVILLVPGAEDVVVPPAATAAFPWWIIVAVVVIGVVVVVATRKKKEKAN